VRGAIDTVAVATTLSKMRGTSVDDDAVGLDAALVALSGRLRLREGCSRSAEAIVTELWNEVFAEPDPAAGENGGEGKAHAPTGASKGR
jgi:MoxR-like ATPase